MNQKPERWVEIENEGWIGTWEPIVALALFPPTPDHSAIVLQNIFPQHFTFQVSELRQARQKAEVEQFS